MSGSGSNTAGGEQTVGDVRCLWNAGALIGEGPIWDDVAGAVYWVDIKVRAIHRYTCATGDKASWLLPEPIGCIARRRRGGFIVGLKSGFALLDRLDGPIKKLGSPEPNLPNNRFNDGKCDAAGRFWAGTMDDAEKSQTGSLYRLDTDRTWHRVDGSYVVTNGPAFSPDGQTIYHTDTLGRTVYAFDLAADGTLTNKRPFVRFGDGDGHPDGMTTDADGFVWIAHWGGWRVTRFTPDGAIDRILELPVAQVTSCVFGRPDLDRLYVTSASYGLDQEARQAQPLAGGLFEAQVGVRGLPTLLYDG